MKATVSPYQTTAICLRIVCENGTTVRLTRYPFDLVMSNATVYLADNAYDFSSVISETSFAASSIDLEGFVGVSNITRDQIASGLFDGARCYLFATSFLAPVEDYEPMMASILGKTTIEDDRFRIEDMSLVDLLNQTVGESHAAACRKSLGGQEFGGCKVDLGPLTVSGSITSIGSSLAFTDSSRSEAADYFGWGMVTFTSGANAGLRPLKIRDYSAGTFTLYEPPYYALTAGVTYSAIPGCRKRLEDCRDKFGNHLRFGGESYIPMQSVVRNVGKSA